MAELEIDGIRKSYRDKEVLAGVTLWSDAGKCIGIVGRNGCGKSTLLQVLAGILRADGGRFTFEGKDCLIKGGEGLRRVGYVPQGEPFFEELTARDNLLMFYGKKQMERSLDGGMLEKLGIGEFLNKRVSKLSGGMKKRLSIGCAMAKEPRLLLLDEPTGALDLPGKLDLYDYFEEYKRGGGIILLVTHDLSETRLCDAVYVLKGGVLTQPPGGNDEESVAEAIR